MKSNFWLLIFTVFLSCNNEQKRTESKETHPTFVRLNGADSILFESNFRILDSAAKHPYQDTMYHCCYAAINFMETYSGIEADVEGDYFGTTGFKKEDLRRWHQWYDSVMTK